MNRAAGFSMVEVLVSVVILSVGLLGTAGLMSASLRNTNTAYYRSQATVFADDILDRMRANVAAARNGDYDVAGDECPGPSMSLALWDCTEWTTALAEALPGGSGSVLYDDENVEIRIEWDDGESSFTTMSRL
jgi:type IV pilus assembly protein PilV